MKIIKLTFLLLFTCSCIEGFSQSAYAGNNFIKNSIKQLSGNFSRAGAEALTEAQVLKLEKVFALKEPKWNVIIRSGKDKGDMNVDMTALDKEFAPMVEEILSKEQKMAFRKILNPQIIK
jgi:hypothetical protein